MISGVLRPTDVSFEHTSFFVIAFVQRYSEWCPLKAFQTTRTSPLSLARLFVYLPPCDSQRAPSSFTFLLRPVATSGGRPSFLVSS